MINRFNKLSLPNCYVPCIWLCTVFVAISCMAVCARADWPGFLGPTGNGVMPNAKLPDEFAPAANGQPAKNVAWRLPIEGRSVGGPIIVGDRVYACSGSGVEQRWLSVTCVSAGNGEILWTRKIKTTGRPYSHPTSANAAPTPCSDGQRIFAFFSSNDLVCYDLDGNLQWYRGLVFDHPKAGNDVGMSSSPVVVDGVVVVQIECQGDSFAAGIDTQTGETRWEVPRPPRANWASPSVAVGRDGSKVVVLQCADNLVAIDPRTGSEAWRIDIKCSTIPTAVSNGGKLYVPSQGIKAFDLANALVKPEQKWESARINPNSSSVLVTEKAVYGLNRSVLVCCDHTGEMKWQARLPAKGSVWATPVIAGDRLFSIDQEGNCCTVQLGETEGKLLATSSLGTAVLGSPALTNNAMFIRSVDALWKIAAN